MPQTESLAWKSWQWENDQGAESAAARLSLIWLRMSCFDEKPATEVNTGGRSPWLKPWWPRCLTICPWEAPRTSFSPLVPRRDEPTCSGDHRSPRAPRVKSAGAAASTGSLVLSCAAWKLLVLTLSTPHLPAATHTQASYRICFWICKTKCTMIYLVVDIFHKAHLKSYCSSNFLLERHPR